MAVAPGCCWVWVAWAVMAVPPASADALRRRWKRRRRRVGVGQRWHRRERWRRRGGQRRQRRCGWQRGTAVRQRRAGGPAAPAASVPAEPAASARFCLATAGLAGAVPRWHRRRWQWRKRAAGRQRRQRWGRYRWGCWRCRWLGRVAIRPKWDARAVSAPTQANPYGQSAHQLARSTADRTHLRDWFPIRGWGREKRL